MDKYAILLVDDEPALLETLSLYLKREFNVYTASNGKEGLETYHANPDISLIILDLEMPEMNGIEMLRKIRAGDKNVKVMIITGTRSYEYAKTCAGLNVDEYMEKGFEVQYLRGKIKKLLGVYECRALESLWGRGYEKKISSLNQVVKKALHYIKESYHMDFCIKEIARSINITHEHLSRIFHKECGIRLKEYIRKVRIEKGKERLINNGRFTIKEVAASIGISDEKHFCRLFKKETGLTPGEYRKSKSPF